MSETDETLETCVYSHSNIRKPDLLLKHTDATLATYKRRQMKHLKHVSEIFAKNT